MRILVAIFFIIVILQTLSATPATSQEMVNVLLPSPNSPISTSSGIYGSAQCTKNSDESYAVCASLSNIAVKYNLQPFSFAAKGPNQGNFMKSCDLYDTESQSTSRAVCLKVSTSTNGIVYFHRVSDMTVNTSVMIGTAGSYSHVIVDTPNQVAYVSNYVPDPSAIYKIINVGSSTPIFAGNLTAFGSGDNTPAAMLIIDGFLYVHLNKDMFNMEPAGLARINISTFTWSETVNFAKGEGIGLYSNLANDNDFIYDLTQNGILVRCTYKNNNFARFDNLNTGLSNTFSLAMSPDSSFLLFAADSTGIILVNTSTFSVESRALLPNPSSVGYAQAFGRPIILSKNNATNSYPVCAFFKMYDKLYSFNFARVPLREAYPTIYPLPSSPINTSSSASASLQCTKDSSESYAICASLSNIAIKYNLQPFSFAAKGPNQDNFITSCDLYETSSQSTSRVVCVKGTEYPFSNGVIYFYRVSDMTEVTNITIGRAGYYPHVIVDTPNQVAYASNYDNPPAIYKITNIAGATPSDAGNLTSFGSGDVQPGAMLVIDGFLYVQFSKDPARLARINISAFTWNQTISLKSGEGYGYYDVLANDNDFIYDLTQNGILVRCTFKNNNFARFGRLNTGLLNTFSLAISPDLRTLFVVSNGNNVLQMVDTKSFSMFGNTVAVPSALGRPIVTSFRYVYAFTTANADAYAFRFTNPTTTRTRTLLATSSTSTTTTATPVTTTIASSANTGSTTTTTTTTSSTAIGSSTAATTSTIVVASTTTTLPANGSNSNDAVATSPSDSSSSAPIIGGVVGGCVLLVIVGVIVFMIRKNQQKASNGAFASGFDLMVTQPELEMNSEL